MNRVVQILMERDGLTEAEAKEQIREAREEMLDAIHSGEDVQDIEEIFADCLGLEPDYLFDVL